MGWEQKQTDNRKHVKRPYCPFRNFCIFLNGEDPGVVLATREYLRKRVDELDFAMDFTNSQVIKLKARIKELEDANSHLEAELVQALKDPFMKYEKKEPSENPKKRGAPFGHEGHFRKKPDKIDKIIDVYLDSCPHCRSEDISPCNHTTKHIQEDLEDGKLTNTCFVHCYYWCPVCKTVVHGWGDNEIPHAFIGPEARAKASFLRHEIKVSYDDTQRTLQHFCGLTISAGAIVAFDDKFSNKAKPLYEALKDSLPQYPFLHADETGWKNDWLWIFTNPYIAFFNIDESRGSKVVIDHLGNFYDGVLITDFWNAYRGKIPAFAKQKCLRHILGDIKKLLEKEDFGDDPKAQGFLENVKEHFKDAIFLYNQHVALTPVEYRSGRKDIIKRFRKLYQHAPLSHHESDNIRKRLITFKNELFVFLKYPETINPTNNFAEIGIRNAVLFRKITFGSMTSKGKKNVSIAMTIIRTALLRGLAPIKILQNITANGVTPELLKQFGLPPAMAQAP
ncbi:MAG: IS66 family transposase [Candidatus Thermoplasmatota archaeon]|nr:IS66 family transposase [Candidatus Thermoplasmatota archaeon]